MKINSIQIISIILFIFFTRNLTGQHSLLGYEMFQSGYDYLYKNSSLRILDLVDLDASGDRDDPVMVGRQILTSSGNVNIIFSYVKFGNVNSMILFDSTGGGSPSLQYCTDGPFAGNVLVLYPIINELKWALIDIKTFQVNYFTTSGNFIPCSFLYTNDGTIWLSAEDLKIFKSSDSGVSFQYYTSIGTGDPNFGTPSKTPSELPLQSSSDGQFLSIVGAFEGAYLSGNPDVVYWYYSTNFGVDWQGEVIGKGSDNHPEYEQIINRDYAPYFTNFAQCNSVVDDSGVTHIVFNGYGQGILPGATDTTEVFPVLYWNSNYREWIAVTDPEREEPDDGHGHSIIDFYPGNSIGNAHPSIMVSSDGMRIIVVWVGPEYTGYTNDPYNIYPGDGGPNSTTLYYTDLYVGFSYDGGQAIGGWNTTYESKYNVSEMYPVCANRINVYFPNWQEQGAYVFFSDATPGVSYLNQNNFSVGSWEIGIEAFYFPSVEREDGLSSFSVEQNYPNPFNPTTSIQYAISSRQFVTLKVYDILGNEIATLVNEEKSPGTYEVEFSGNNLPSGVYFYQLKVADPESSSGQGFVETKKMILLK